MRGHHILDAPAGARIASFTVQELLGTGSSGVVYRAARGEEVVALKLQRLEGQAERESVLLSRLKHRNVVGFRGCGPCPALEPRWFFLAMEYVHGRTLKQWVEEENPGARRAAELLRGMTRGLEAAHAARVLHRDVKECNVVVREEDGEAVLVDFGAGQELGAPAPAPGVLLPGTQRYRSPEARALHRDGGCRPHVPSPADDLYALGVVFYWVLTGRHPLEGEDTPVAPEALNPRVPPVLGALCLRLLSERPEARGSARELCEALETALAGADARWETALGEATAEAMDGPPRRGGHLRAPEPGPVALEVRAHPVPPASARSVALLRAVALAGLVAVLAYAARPWLQAPGHPEVARDVSALPRGRP